MKTIVAILALALLAVGPAAAESVVPPGHHAKGTHGKPGASYYAPGHQKHLFMQKSARRVSPGHMK